MANSGCFNGLALVGGIMVVGWLFTALFRIFEILGWWFSGKTPDRNALERISSPFVRIYSFIFLLASCYLGVTSYFEGLALLTLVSVIIFLSCFILETTGNKI